MTSIPSNFDRIPTRLASQLTRQGISAANAQVLRAQVELSSSKRVLKPSDDPIAATLINVIDQRLSLASQRERNLEHASSVMGTLDQSLGHLTEAAQDAKEIASSQVGVQSDPGTRRQQAVIVQSLIDSTVQSLNRHYAGLHLFGGELTGRPPIESFYGGYRYVGASEGLITDLGGAATFPITIGADLAIGALSARHKGNVNLNPSLTLATNVADLRGPGGALASLGSIDVTIDNGTPATISVDLSAAKTAGDVANIIESAVRAQDPAALAGAFPTALTVAGERFSLAVAAGYTITFADGPTGQSATQLGLANFTYDNINPTNTDPLSILNPRLTDHTTLGSLNPASPVTYGTITFRNGGRSGTVTTNAAMTIGQFKEAVERLDLGIRLDIDPSGDSLNIINEVSGFSMAVEESGGTAAATLGLRTVSSTASLSTFNHGRGVTIADGQINPVTTLPDPTRNVDFRVTLTNGSAFTVDLVPADIATVQDLLNKINAEAAAAGFGAIFTASLSANTNGIEFQDTSGGAGQIAVASLNAYAAEDLGLLDATFTSGAPARLVAQDRSSVRVDSMITTLIDLRAALEASDSIGITVAGERLELAAEQTIQARALVGGRAARVEEAKTRLEDTTLLDQTIKSNLQDLDYIEAASRFSLLQTQLQAGLQSAAAIRSLTLLNFLG
jgi:flagellin-like hook-associated protein FlgL